MDLRASTLITHIAALARDVGRINADVDDRAQVLRAEIRTAGVTYTELVLDHALAFHHAARDDQDQVATTIARLRENTRGGDFAYYSGIAAFMADLPGRGSLTDALDRRRPSHASAMAGRGHRPPRRPAYFAVNTATARASCSPGPVQPITDRAKATVPAKAPQQPVPISAPTSTEPGLLRRKKEGIEKSQRTQPCDRRVAEHRRHYNHGSHHTHLNREPQSLRTESNSRDTESRNGQLRSLETLLNHRDIIEITLIQERANPSFHISVANLQRQSGYAPGSFLRVNIQLSFCGTHRVSHSKGVFTHHPAPSPRGSPHGAPHGPGFVNPPY
ncbi:hypothetical protein [Streptomyces sp. NPDC126522]|uniref:hypothetical protein n=1 Tax=Streptomyces sp. NPDC126522 TaxID=3155211 RepID=UPI0033324D72